MSLRTGIARLVAVSALFLALSVRTPSSADATPAVTGYCELCGDYGILAGWHEFEYSSGSDHTCSGAPGTYDPSDTDCHFNEDYEGYCEDNHRVCLNSAYDASTLQGVNDASRVRAVLEQNAGKIVYNESRRSIQAFDCKGRVVANVPINDVVSNALANSQ
jgi:hypothetical protein